MSRKTTETLRDEQRAILLQQINVRVAIRYRAGRAIGKFGTTNRRNNTVNGERLEYFLGVSARIGGEPLQQQRAPGAILDPTHPPGALTI
jgi:hypothetical protein